MKYKMLKMKKKITLNRDIRRWHVIESGVQQLADKRANYSYHYFQSADWFWVHDISLWNIISIQAVFENFDVICIMGKPSQSYLTLLKSKWWRIARLICSMQTIFSCIEIILRNVMSLSTFRSQKLNMRLKSNFEPYLSILHKLCLSKTVLDRWHAL